MHLHRDLGVTQKTAWFLAQRIREAWVEGDTPPFPFEGPVEFDETFLGGRRKWMRTAKKKALLEEYGRGFAALSTVVGARDRDTNEIRARVVEGTDKATLQGFVREQAAPGTTVYTDEGRGYIGLEDDYEHETVNHSVGEYVKEMASTNGLESFWSMLRRAHAGTYHQFSKKHLQRYVDEFSGRHNQRNFDTSEQMARVVQGLVGRRLTYNQLVGKPDKPEREVESSLERAHESSASPPPIPLAAAAE